MRSSMSLLDRLSIYWRFMFYNHCNELKAMFELDNDWASSVCLPHTPPYLPLASPSPLSPVPYKSEMHSNAELSLAGYIYCYAFYWSPFPAIMQTTQTFRPVILTLGVAPGAAGTVSAQGAIHLVLVLRLEVLLLMPSYVPLIGCAQRWTGSHPIRGSN